MKFRITQVKTSAHARPEQKAALKSLKLGKIGASSVYPDSPPLRGNLRNLLHLVIVEVEGEPEKGQAGFQGKGKIAPLNF